MADSRNEPSMDEILSSIKRIIADDDRSRPATKRAAKAALSEDDEEILELTEAANGDEALLDGSKAQSLRHSFSALQTLSEPGVAPQIVRSGETSLEGLTRELLRPMLKEWLDTNLPPIVEAMVEREITRITKKG
jgi:cell pole-organizing protein PopZ